MVKQVTDWLIEASKPLHEQVYNDLSHARAQVSRLHSDNLALQSKLDKLDIDLARVQGELERSKQVTDSPIDAFLKKKFGIISNIAYKQKRGNKKEGYYSVWLNQMITPDSWEVQNFKRKFIKKDGNLWADVSTIGDALAKHTTWADEQKLYDTGDYYLYPEETLTFMKAKCDCEDVSYTMASFFPDSFGVCYGFFIQDAKTKFGHAFPCFVYNNKLYIVETTGNTVEITGFEDGRYETYFIITKNNTYQVRSGVRFGDIASWE